MPLSPYQLLPHTIYGHGLSAATACGGRRSGPLVERRGHGDLVAKDAELLAVPFAADLAPAIELPVPAAALLAHYQAKGEAGEVIEVPVANGDAVGRVLLYGVGDGSAADLRKAGAAVARRGKGRGRDQDRAARGAGGRVRGGRAAGHLHLPDGEKKSTLGGE